LFCEGLSFQSASLRARCEDELGLIHARQSARTYNLDMSHQMHFAVFSDDVLANPAAILPIGGSGAPETNMALIGDSDFKVPAAVEFADLLWSRGGRFKDLIVLRTFGHLLAPFAQPREALRPTARTTSALQEKSTHSGRARPTRPVADAVSPLSGLIPPELRKMFCVGNFADADWNQGRSKRFIGMRSDVPRLAIFHGIGTGVFAFILAALSSKGLNDPSTRLVLIAVFSLWTAVGSGITAFLMLNVEDRKQSPSSRR
jgi:hypothetical protein